jgi:ATP synthase protein I
MTDDPTIEPSDEERLRALDEKLRRLEARKTKDSDSAAETGSGQGMQVLAELLVGIFGGLGLGWLFDSHFQCAPLGMIVGVLLGMVSSIYLIVKRAKD